MDLTYENWLAGYFVGDLKQFGFSSTELKKISERQRVIFNERVDAKYQRLVQNFTKQESDSIDKDKFWQSEIQSLDYLLNTDDLPYKGTPQTKIQIGRFHFLMSHIAELRNQYRLAVMGELDLGIISPPAQQVRSASGNAIQNCMVDAVAYSKYFYFLKDHLLVRPSDEYFSPEHLAELHVKMDKLMDEVRAMKHQSTHGQEIIYDEIQELKNLPALKKKTLDEIVKGKIINLFLTKAVDPSVLKWLYRELTGLDFPALNP